MGNFALVSPETPSGDGGMEKKTPEKKGNGKDGMEVWPEEVEEAFFEGMSASATSMLRTVLTRFGYSFTTDPEAWKTEGHGQRKTLRTKRAHCGLHPAQDWQAALP